MKAMRALRPMMGARYAAAAVVVGTVLFLGAVAWA